MKVIDPDGLAHSPGTGVVLGFDGPSPLAQILRACHADAIANTAGANLTIAAGRGTGTGAGGSILFQTAAAGASGSNQNALTTQWSIDSAGVLKPNADNARDIGTPSLRIANLYAAQLVVPTGGASDSVVRSDGSAVFGNGGFGIIPGGGVDIGDGELHLNPDGSADLAGSSFRIAADGKFGFFGVTPVARQATGASLTNNVTSGGSQDIIADFSDLTTYSNSAGTIRSNFYRLAEKLKKLDDSMRAYGFST